MNSKLRTDLRVEPTTATLIQAMMGLVSEQGYENVTVADLCRQADVNRATFYNHFSDKDDLLFEIIGAHFGMISIKLNPIDRPIAAYRLDQPSAPALGFINTIADNPAFYRDILRFDRSEGLGWRLHCFVRDLLRERIATVADDPSPGPVPLDFAAEFVTASVLGTLQSWLREIDRHSSKDIAIWLMTLLSLGVHRTLLLDTPQPPTSLDET